MKILAHMGVEHSSSQETALHQSTNSALVIVAVTAAVVIVMALAIYLVKRFAEQRSAVNNDEENQ